MSRIATHLGLSVEEIRTFQNHDFLPCNLSFLIKDHKPRDADNTFPLRPIANINGSGLFTLDSLVSKILNEISNETPITIKDTTTFLRDIKTSFRKYRQMLPNGNRVIYLASLDVVNLYPSVNARESIPYIHKLLKKRYPATDHNFVDLIKEALYFLCSNNYVSFDNTTFLQKSGVPMGGRSSPMIANLTLRMIEEKVFNDLRPFLFNNNFMPPRLKCHIVSYYRYVDDIIIIFSIPKSMEPIPIWQGVIDTFNAQSANIKFTSDTSESFPFKQLNFLDTTFQIDREENLTYKWYRKSMHSNLMIHAQSNLSMSCKNYTMIQTFVRIFERTYPTDTMTVDLLKIRNDYIALGYPIHLVLKNITLALNKFNTNVHYKTWPRFDNLIRIPFINEQTFEEMKCTITSELNTFGIAPQICPIYGKQITEYITLHSGPSNLLTENSPFCETPLKCPICSLNISSDHRSRLPNSGVVNDRVNNINGNKKARKVQCTKASVVYKLECRHCHKCYVGKTIRMLRCRIAEHRNRWRKTGCLDGSPTPHKCTTLWENMWTIEILEQEKNRYHLAVKEYLHIDRLRPALNDRSDLKGLLNLNDASQISSIY